MMVAGGIMDCRVKPGNDNLYAHNDKLYAHNESFYADTNNLNTVIAGFDPAIQGRCRAAECGLSAHG